MALLTRGHKTKFPTVYPTIYLPKNENFEFSYTLIVRHRSVTCEKYCRHNIRMFDGCEGYKENLSRARKENHMTLEDKKWKILLKTPQLK